MNCEVTSRAKECFAMMMIGDGVLAIVDPVRHISLWKNGPSWWQAMIEPFARRPEMTRLVGVAETLAGVWLAARQKPEVVTA
jgi:hypothetical protein